MSVIISFLPKPLVGIVVACFGMAGVFYTLYRASESDVFFMTALWLLCCVGLGLVAVSGAIYGFSE